MTEPLSPQAAQALASISNIEGMLDRYKRALRIPSVPFRYNVGPAFRAVAQAHYALALGWNAGLASVPNLPAPEPVVEPSVPSANTESTADRWTRGRFDLNQHTTHNDD